MIGRCLLLCFMCMDLGYCHLLGFPIWKCNLFVGALFVVYSL